MNGVTEAESRGLSSEHWQGPDPARPIAATHPLPSLLPCLLSRAGWGRVWSLQLPHGEVENPGFGDCGSISLLFCDAHCSDDDVIMVLSRFQENDL